MVNVSCCCHAGLASLPLPQSLLKLSQELLLWRADSLVAKCRECVLSILEKALSAKRRSSTEFLKQASAVIAQVTIPVTSGHSKANVKTSKHKCMQSTRSNCGSFIQAGTLHFKCAHLVFCVLHIQKTSSPKCTDLQSLAHVVTSLKHRCFSKTMVLQVNPACTYFCVLGLPTS